MTELSVFAFQENMVRVHQDENGDPWFVAKDVCKVLGIEWKGSGTTGPLLDDDERGSVVVDTPGGPQQMLTVSESGLYALIFRSRKPQAKAFSRQMVSAMGLPKFFHRSPPLDRKAIFRKSASVSFVGVASCPEWRIFCFRASDAAFGRVAHIGSSLLMS